MLSDFYSDGYEDGFFKAKQEAEVEIKKLREQLETALKVVKVFLEDEGYCGKSWIKSGEQVLGQVSGQVLTVVKNDAIGKS